VCSDIRLFSFVLLLFLCTSPKPTALNLVCHRKMELSESRSIVDKNMSMRRYQREGCFKYYGFLKHVSL